LFLRVFPIRIEERLCTFVQGGIDREEYFLLLALRIGVSNSPLQRARIAGRLIMMADTTNLLLTFAGLNGALTCLTLWKISHEETKKGRKLAWNLPFQKRRKPAKKRKRGKPSSHATQSRTRHHVKPATKQKGVDILPPQYNLPKTEIREEESPYLEGEWEVIA
jgi:hypothetical protein